MAELEDETFYDRADAHINISNEQLKLMPPERVAASTAFASARFTTWMCTNMCKDKEEMASRRQEAIDTFVGAYRKMFEDNFDEYLDNFDTYRQTAQRV